MLYKNCHYKYKDRICEFMDFLPETDGEDSKVKIRYTNGKESICLASELCEIPLTESILQSCYKSKTYIRDGNWDIIWHLGGTNKVTVGEKSGNYYLLPAEKVKTTVVDILPWEIIKSDKVIESPAPQKLYNLSELEMHIPEIQNYINRKRL